MLPLGTASSISPPLVGVRHLSILKVGALHSLVTCDSLRLYLSIEIGHLGRAVGLQSKSIKEVPNLDNVSAFLSDPLTLEEDAAPTSKVQVPGEPVGSGKECPVELIDDFDPAKVLKLVDRVLSSAWKFNPYLGASPGAMGPFPKDLELNSNEFEFANRKKIIKDTAIETRLRADTARGLFELQNINKRNKKNLSITPWPEDISFLNDKAFAEQVNLNAFHSRNSIPDNGNSRVHDTPDDVCHDDRQGVSHLSKNQFTLTHNHTMVY